MMHATLPSVACTEQLSRWKRSWRRWAAWVYVHAGRMAAVVLMAVPAGEWHEYSPELKTAHLDPRGPEPKILHGVSFCC